MKRSLFFFITLLFNCTAVYAQLPLTGKVYELDTHVILPSVKVQNMRTKDNTLTNNAGLFTIQAKAGDILVLTDFAYQPDTVVVTNSRLIEIYLTPQSRALKEVTIQNTSTKLGNLKDPNLQNQALRYQTDANGNPIGGIAIRFGYGKSAQDKKNAQVVYEENATQQIDKAFSPENVSKYVPLKGNDLKQFIGLYRPMISDFKAPGFDLTLYLNDCYEKFMLLPPDQRKIQSLKPDTAKKQ